MLICPITDIVNLDHLVEVVTARYLHYKVFFPFVINKYFIERYFETITYCFSFYFQLPV